MTLPRRRLIQLGLAAPAAGLATSAAGGLGASADAATAGDRPIQFRQWDSTEQLQRGFVEGAAVMRGRVMIGKPTTRRTVGSTRYEQSTWTSPWVRPGFAFTELIPSWSATTPGDSFVEVRVRGRDAAGRSTSWDLMARWCSGDKYLARRTFSGQDDEQTDVNVDTWRAPGGLADWQVRVSLARRVGTTFTPTLDAVGAVASRLPAAAGATSKPGVARGIVLDVPRYSQMIHRGHSPQWGSGGQAWCSPTSTSMVLGYYDALPNRSSYAWVGAGHVDPWVDHAARMTFDHAYDGCGNWPFNTAYAAPKAGKAFVTRLRSLREAERFVKAGIPLVASISFDAGELDGAPISATAGHLMVIAGFTQAGDVVVNDPASSTRDGVRRTYRRSQFEKQWLEAAGGLVYVIHDAAHPLPPKSPGTW